jgi:GNAT superfamily N-acetyltransferase
VTADLTIRLLTPDFAWDQYLDLTMRAFGLVDGVRIRANIDSAVADGRCLGAFAGDRMVGSALFLDLRQWWHGRAVPMAGVAGVQIAPEDRGRGIGRAVMTALTELMAGRGYPLAALYPATMTVYRSLGWEIAGHRHEVRLPARSLFALAKPGRLGRWRQPGRRCRPGRRVRRRPVHAGRLLTSRSWPGIPLRSGSRSRATTFAPYMPGSWQQLADTPSAVRVPLTAGR